MSKEDKIYKPIVDALGITNKKARKKAFDFMNILDYKVPSMGKVPLFHNSSIFGPLPPSHGPMC